MMSSESHALDPGSVVDRFLIDRAISFGSSTVTYQASEKSTGNTVLLREFIPAGGATRDENGVFQAVDEPSSLELSTSVASFLADCAGVATLSHPSLSKLSRWFRANGTAYMVMTWLPGESLAMRIQREGRLSPLQISEIVRPVLEALDYLHKQEVFHLEISPQTVYLSEDKGAMLLGVGGSGGQVTIEPGLQPDQTAGPYAAIEQILPDYKIGPWTDIYGLAATLQHCISGEAPPGSLQRWQKVQNGEADPLERLESVSGGDQSQREIATLIRRGMALEPSARPQSLREWRARITRAAVDTDEKAPEPVSEYETEGREWLPIILLAVFITSVVAVGLYLLLNRQQDEGPGDTQVTAEASDWASPEEKERWRQALEANAVIGFRSFMQDYPESIHNQQAQEHIDRLEDQAWEAVLVENTKAAFESHLDEFPQGLHATEALARIEEFRQEEERLARENAERIRRDDTAWAEAKTAGSVAGLDQYISAWPGGIHIDEARELRRNLQSDINDSASFQIAQTAHSIEAYRAYIGDFPAGRHVLKAQQAIEDLTLRSGKSFRDCTDCPLMVVIPAGAFWQGSAEASTLAMSLEKPRRRVVIAEPFAVSAYEITMAQWDACVADTGCDTRPADNSWGRGNRPVILVSWNDAIQYSAWLSKKTGQSYSLPSESEWEYFARAGEERDWLGGDAASICDYANIAGSETNFDWRHTACADSSPVQTSKAGTFKANAFGLYDVIGNVAEWTLDCMNLSYLEAPTDGSAWSRGMCSSRMTRGGSWFTGTKESRLPARFNLRNGDRNDFTGFRLVRRVEKQ